MKICSWLPGHRFYTYAEQTKQLDNYTNYLISLEFFVPRICFESVQPLLNI